jgi:hypothetical protein
LILLPLNRKEKNGIDEIWEAYLDSQSTRRTGAAPSVDFFLSLASIFEVHFFFFGRSHFGRSRGQTPPYRIKTLKKVNEKSFSKKEKKKKPTHSRFPSSSADCDCDLVITDIHCL